MNPELTTEQAIKALQAQNAQFQEMVIVIGGSGTDCLTLVREMSR